MWSLPATIVPSRLSSMTYANIPSSSRTNSGPNSSYRWPMTWQSLLFALTMPYFSRSAWWL